MQPPLVNIPIIAETPDLLVVDKPAGLLVHPTKPGGPVTLRDFLCELLAYDSANSGQVSIINRLDRETSGLTLIAKSAAAARECGISMARHDISKQYIAMVIGWPENDNFSVDAPLLRAGEISPSAIYLKRGVHPSGADALTHFVVTHRCAHPDIGKIAVVHATPITGRTHQIRVHLSHVGFPVIGDKIYGPDEQWYLRFVEGGWSPAMEKALVLSRHALHSSELKITFRGEQFAWAAPLPSDMASLLASATIPSESTRGQQ